MNDDRPIKLLSKLFDGCMDALIALIDYKRYLERTRKEQVRSRRAQLKLVKGGKK